jgi:hypothetical protein
MALTWEETMYDLYVTVGRAESENSAFERAVTVGILSDYLEGDPVTDYDTSDLHDLFMEGVAEGRAEHRFNYTAEELFVWAHEFDNENL